MAETVLAASTASGASDPWSRWRVILIRVWAGVLTLLMLVMAQGIVMIGSADADQHFMYASSTVWKLLSLGGVAFVLWTGGRNVVAYWAIAIGQLVWAIAGLLAPQSDGNGAVLSILNLVLFYGPLIALRPHRRELLRPHLQVSPALLAIACAASVPLILFAVRLARRLHGELGFDMVGLYLILPAMGLFAALQPRGGRLLAPIVGAAAVLTGVTAMVYPQDTASAGRVGGALLITGGLAFAVAGRQRRRNRHRLASRASGSGS